MAASATPIAVTVPPLTGGAGLLPTVDYTVELTALAAAVKTITAQIIIINREIGLLSTSLNSMGADLTILQTYITAVQSPTGDFRTLSPEDVIGDALVQTALAKSGIVVTGGATT